MNPQELEISKRSYDILAAVAIGIGTAFLFACVYLFVGLFLGVIGIHRSPTQASQLFFYLSPVVLIPGFAASFTALHLFRKQSRSKRKQNAEHVVGGNGG
jgi:hypothetical protein